MANMLFNINDQNNSETDNGFIPDKWRSKRPKGVILSRWQQGRDYHIHGLTKPGQRHHACERVCHYLFFGDPSRLIPAAGYGHEEERLERLLTWIEQKHNNYSREINNDNWKLVINDCRSMAYWTPTRQQQPPATYYSKESNELRAEKTKAKILAGVEELKTTGVSTQREMSRISGVSIPTLMKYRLLWAHLLAIYKQSVTEQSIDHKIRTQGISQ